jgi:hypothetical protein
MDICIGGTPKSIWSGITKDDAVSVMRSGRRILKRKIVIFLALSHNNSHRFHFFSTSAVPELSLFFPKPVLRTSCPF